MGTVAEMACWPAARSAPMTKAEMAARKPGQFTGKWEVLTYSGTVLCTGLRESEAVNLLDNHRRQKRLTTMRRERVPIPPDIAALDMGDDD